MVKRPIAKRCDTRYSQLMIKRFRHKGLERFSLEGKKSGISPEMALKIEAWLGAENGGRTEIWAGMQLDYDMWKARQRRQAA